MRGPAVFDGFDNTHPHTCSRTKPGTPDPWFWPSQAELFQRLTAFFPWRISKLAIYG
jgi:hypothetical protein